MYKLAPSMLSADFTKLGEQLSMIEKSGAHYLHIDVMDGMFVPNISMGMPVIKSIRPSTKMVFDVHLMIEEPIRYVDAFAKAGADIICVHTEACENLNATLDKIIENKKIAAVVIKPNTDIEAVYSVIDKVKMVLIMSVEPGFGGQSLISDTLRKSEKLANYLSKNGSDIDIEMDGGIYLDNVRDVLNAGVNVIVAGSSVFGTPDCGKTVKDFYDVFSGFEPK